MLAYLEAPVSLGTLSSWSRGRLQEKLQHASVNAAEAREIWESLINFLKTPNLSEKHITSTCNCLRIFLKSSSLAQNLDSGKLPLFRDEWMRCYEAVCYAWNRAKVKPLAQLLEVLLQVAKNDLPTDELESVWRSISGNLSAVVLSGQPPRDLKRALALSSFFLEKNLPYQIYLDSVQDNTRQTNSRTIGGNPIEADAQRSLIYAVLLSFGHHDAQSSAEKCLKSVLRASVEDASYTKSWWVLLKQFTADHADSLDSITSSVFPILLEQHSQGYLPIVHSETALDDKNELLFSLALLQSCRERELISQDGASPGCRTTQDEC